MKSTPFFIKLLFSLAFSAQIYAASSSAPLSKEAICEQMELLFSQHVEFSKMQPALIQRSFKALIEQFDPEKIYLLQSEIAPYYKLSGPQIEKVLNSYEEANFFEYEALLKLIAKAIVRAKAFRQEVALELALTGEVVPGSGKTYLNFAKSEQQLKQRLKKRASMLLINKIEERGELFNTASNRQKLLQLWDKRCERKEAPYLKEESKVPSEQSYLTILKSLAKSLDSHTAFYSTSEAEQLRDRLEKEFYGVGISLKEEVDGIFVASVVPNGPAARGGLVVPDDELYQINGIATKDLTYEEILAQMRSGPKRESPLVLGLRRGEKEHLVSLQRERIVLDNERLVCKTVPFEDGQIALFTLHSFYESERGSSEKDMKAAFARLQKEGPIKGVILDLRENSGGFLRQAVKVGGLFIKNGVIVISKYAGGQVRHLRNQEGRPIYNGPLIVLTSKMSASAAEIVAGALQDHGAALVVGDERTYGKGSIQVQTLTDPKASSFYKVTVGRYYTASGRSAQIDGVAADILLPSRFAPYRIGECYLEYPLSKDCVDSALSANQRDQDAQHWLARELDFQGGVPGEKTIALIDYLTKRSRARQLADPIYSNYLEELKLLAAAEGQTGTSSKAKERPLPAARISRERQGEGQIDFQTREAFSIMEDLLLWRDRNRAKVAP